MDAPPLSPPPVLTVERVDARNALAARLLGEMCAELERRYHRPPSPYAVEEAEAPRAGFVVASLGGEPVGCGALRCLDETTVEVKRMYVAPGARRRGVARRLLAELERLAAAYGYRRIILETGVFQPEALALYDATGYRRTPTYGRYVGNPDAVCFEKWIVPPPPEGKPPGQ